MEYTLKTADYIKQFKCIGGECKLSCCKGWDILWLNDEYQKLKNADCSEKLRKIINESFTPYENNNDIMVVKLCEDGECPMHDRNDGLCMIQKELGTEYLSLTCQCFPTYGTINNHVLCETRMIGCPAVFDIITSEEKACDYYLYSRKKDVNHTHYATDKINDMLNNPVLKHRNALFDFFYGIMSDKNADFKTSLIICTLAAQKLSEFEKESSGRIPDIIEALKKQSKNPSLYATFDDIKPNYAFKFKAANVAFDFLCTDSISDTKMLKELHSVLHNGRDVDVKDYSSFMERFYKAFAEKPFFMKNILRTLYTNNCLPFKDNKYTIFENFAFLHYWSA